MPRSLTIPKHWQSIEGLGNIRCWNWKWLSSCHIRVRQKSSVCETFGWRTPLRTAPCQQWHSILSSYNTERVKGHLQQLSSLAWENSKECAMKSWINWINYTFLVITLQLFFLGFAFTFHFFFPPCFICLPLSICN